MNTRTSLGRRLVAAAVAMAIALGVISLRSLRGRVRSNRETGIRPAASAQVGFPATFRVADGWNQLSTGPFDQGSGEPLTWAVSGAFSRQDLDTFVKDGSSPESTLEPASFGLDTVSGLDPTGILILVGAVPDAWGLPGPPEGLDPISEFPSRSLPLQVSDAVVLTAWKGQISSSTVQYVLGAQAGSNFLDVRLFFGTPSPSAELLAAAQLELDNLVLPDYEVGSATAPPTFAAQPAWNTIGTSTVAIDPGSSPDSWAATVPFARTDLATASARAGVLWYSAWPSATIEGLSPDGIVIIAGVQGTGFDGSVGGANTLDRSPSFDLSKAEVQLEWEGQDNPNAPMYVIWAGTQDPSIEVRVFFGRPDPTCEMLSRAQQELSTMMAPTYISTS